MLANKRIFSWIDKDKKNILSLVRQIADISSPTFSETKKILFLQKYLKKINCQALIDKAGNLYGKIGKGEPQVLVVAHTDTVLVPEKPVREDKKYFRGHGVCDNSVGVVALITVLQLIKKFNLKFPGTLQFAFTVQEEGAGAKAGMKYLVKKNKNLAAVINLESHNLGRIVNQSPGQYRVKINLESKKVGHSFRDFGHPNPIVIASQVIADFAKLPGFKKGQTSFNIGKIKGGEKINVIPQKIEFFLEIRSVKQTKLNFLKDNLQKLLNSQKGIKITQEILADTQAVSMPKNHKIFKLVQKVHKNLGIKSFFDMGNNDGEVSMALRIPTVTLGSSFGFKTHSQNEYVDKDSIILGIKQDFLVISASFYTFSD